MATQEQLMETYFNKFLASKHRLKMVKIKPHKKRWGIEYEFDFVDEWETTGWILYKPFFATAPRFYMFKGKSYEPIQFKKIKWFQWIRRFDQWMVDREHQPDWAMRNKAEWHIAMGWIKVVIVVAALGILLLMPTLMAKLTGRDETAPVPETAPITQSVEEGQAEAQ